MKGYVGFFFLLHLNVIFFARRKVLVFFSRLPLGLFLSSAWVITFFNNHSTNRRTRYKGRFPKLRVRVRYALSLAARRRALARGKKDSLRVLQGEWQCYQQNLSFVFLFQLLTRYLVRGSLQSSSFITVGWAFLKRESVTFPSYIREKWILS